MMKVIVSGAAGHMGKEVIALCDRHYYDSELAGMVDIGGGDGICASLRDCTAKADVLIDFSNHMGTATLLSDACLRKLPAVIATTGHTDEEKQQIFQAAKTIPVFYTANMSMGIALLTRLIKETAAALPGAEIEIVETHHNRKLDAPSGTALMLADSIREVRPETYAHSGRTGQGKRTPEEIGIHSLRMGGVVGRHEVIFSSGNETVTLTHEAHSRAQFAQGAMAAASFLYKKSAGLYSMKDLIES